MDEIEFGYEERSKRLIERLDRIQNYLQSLPPLPEIGNAIASEEIIEKDLKEEDMKADRVQSAGSLSSEGSTSGRTSTQRLSRSHMGLICKSQTIPKDNCCSVLLQQSASPSRSESPSSQFSEESSKTSETTPKPSDREVASSKNLPESSKTSETTPKHSFHEEARQKKKKKKYKDLRVQDPLRPTGRTSFGVDIGQGINVINYIKQNSKPGSESRAQRLTAVITKEIHKGFHTERSLDRMYRQPPLPESSILDCSSRWSDSSRSRAQLGTLSTKRSAKGSSPFSGVASSDLDVYRVRYLDRAVELPHYHGLDTLQELFVPYSEHNEHEKVGKEPL